MFIIRYDSLSTTNGKQVGLVYAQRVADVIPGYPPDVWSSTKNPAEATTFATREEAESCGPMQRRWWRAATVVELEQAEVLA